MSEACDETRAWLAALGTGLSAETPETAARHLAHCARCPECGPLERGYRELVRTAESGFAYAPSAASEAAFLAAAQGGPAAVDYPEMVDTARASLRTEPGPAAETAFLAAARAAMASPPPLDAEEAESAPSSSTPSSSTPPSPVPSPPTPSSPAMLWAAAAAVAALLVGGGLWVSLGSGPPARSAELVVRSVEGPVQLDGQPAGAPSVLAEGVTIATGTGRLSAGGLESAVVRVAPQSTVRVAAWGARTRLELTGGSVESEVARRAPGGLYEVQTPNARVVVLGTRFTVTYEGGETRVRCAHGRVRVEHADGRVAGIVGSGEQLSIGRANAQNARRLEPDAARRAASSTGPVAALEEAPAPEPAAAPEPPAPQPAVAPPAPPIATPRAPARAATRDSTGGAAGPTPRRPAVAMRSGTQGTPTSRLDRPKPPPTRARRAAPAPRTPPPAPRTPPPAPRTPPPAPRTAPPAPIRPEASTPSRVDRAAPPTSQTPDQARAPKPAPSRRAPVAPPAETPPTAPTVSPLEHARGLLASGRDADAIAALEAIPPGDWRRDALLGDAYQVTGRPTKARDAYARAADTAGSRPPAAVLADLARVQSRQLRDASAARATWARYLEHHPKGPDAPRAHLALADGDSGVEHLDIVLERFPQSPEADRALSRRARGHFAAADWDAAHTLLRPYRQARRPAQAETALVGLARIHLARGALNAAEARLNEHAERFPRGARRGEADRLRAALETARSGPPAP